MTDVPDVIVTADQRLIERVREAFKPDRTLSAALRDAAAALHIEIKWHEADMLAAAIGHHYTHTVTVHRVIHPAVDGLAARELASQQLCQDLALAVIEQGFGLVEEPIESGYFVSPDTYYTSLDTDKLPPKSMRPARGDFPVVVLTGHCRKLVKAS